MSGDIEVVEEYWFPSMVWYADLDDCQALNAQMLQDIGVLRQEVETVKRSNELGWHSPTDFHQHDEFSDLCDVIHEMAGTIAMSMKVAPDRQFEIETFWVNVNPKHAHNALHDHPNSDLSGVYYVSVNDNSGALRFRDPRGAKRMNPWPLGKDTKRDKRHWDRVSYKPVAGRLILFPSWLEHDVEPNLSDEERVSISFNLSARKN